MVNLSDLQVDSALSYAVALAFPALDAIVPLVPSETAIVGLGVTTAGSTDPRIFLLVLLAATGAFLGDNLCYVIGRRFAPWVETTFFSSEKGLARRAWAERTLEHFGTRLIVVCRFIPGGRTAVMLTCGVIHFPRRPFVMATAVAGVMWATYAFLIGRIGGKVFENKAWAGLLLALGLALVVSAVIELVRRGINRRKPSGKATSGSL